MGLGAAPSAPFPHSGAACQIAPRVSFSAIGRKQPLFKALGGQDDRKRLPNKVADLIGKGRNFHLHLMDFYKLGPIIAFSGSDFCFGIFQNAMMGVA